MTQKIEPSIVGDELHIPLPTLQRHEFMERLCRALADDDDVAALMLKIADAAKKGERASYSLLKLDALAGTTYLAHRMSPLEARILADDIFYITPDSEVSA